MSVLGLTVPMDGSPLGQLATVLDRAEGAGFTDIWSSEITTDAFTPLAVSAATHPRLRVGAAIASVFARSPAMMAMSAAALAELGAAETLIGIGASSDVVVEKWHGGRFVHPYQRVRDVLRFTRRALTGERMTFTSDSFTIDGFRLESVPVRQPKLLVGALREGMLRLAGRESDGVILNWLSPGDVPTVTRHVLEHNPDALVVARLFAVVSADRAQARNHARRLITAYLNVPAYAEFHRWLGRGAVLEPMWKAWAAGDRKGALAAVPDALVDELFLTGSPDDIRAGVDAYVKAGVDTPVLAVMALDRPGIEAVGQLGPGPSA
jgi:probable F420-dependent oxidoreductase